MSRIAYTRDTGGEDTQAHPWHSPRCYEDGAHRDSSLCTCGLTKLEQKYAALAPLARAAFRAWRRLRTERGAGAIKTGFHGAMRALGVALGEAPP